MTKTVDQTLRNLDNDHLIYILLYGSKKFNFNLNKEIIKVRWERTFRRKSYLE